MNNKSITENGNVICAVCKKKCKNDRGLKQHSRFCGKSITVDQLTAQQPQQDLVTTPSHQNMIDINNTTREDNFKDEYKTQIFEAYEKIVYWRKNLFELPKGAIGKEFIKEMTRQINDWSSKSPDRDISLKSLMVMPSLLLQRTSIKCKSSEIKRHLERRMQLWKDKKVNELIHECVAIQTRLQKGESKVKENKEIARRFSRLMMQGKVNPAIRLLDQEISPGILSLTDETLKCLHDKHPNAEPKYNDMLLNGPLRIINTVIYDNINADLVRKCAIKTKGASGPSGLDADFWRRIVGSNIYGNVTDDLCHAIALMARTLCGEDLTDPESISPLMACRLIPLDKSPGVRPIGIGEVLRRIIGKSVMSITKSDILEATGYNQLCAGQEAGCEVAVHAIRDLYESEETHGFIQIDASNAFNSINRNVLLHNIKVLCPEIATYIINCYIKPARLFVSGGVEISSKEGTTQGDPVAMGMYALGMMPLLTTVLQNDTNDITQVAFADDLTGIGTLNRLKHWWDMVLTYGPFLGYYVNEKKSWLIVKEQYLENAKHLFSTSKIKITIDGNRHLGAVVGTEKNKEKYVSEKVSEWILQIGRLSEIAKSQPHAAFSAFNHGLRHRYTYLMRTIPGISSMLTPLDEAIDKFIKVLLNDYNFNPDERLLFSLPAKFGGMGIIIPSMVSDTEYRNSRSITKETIERVTSQELLFRDNKTEIAKIKNKIKTEKRKSHLLNLSYIKSKIICKMKTRAIEGSIENGASNWLTVLPLKNQGFFLDKQAFWDGLYLRYGIPLPRLPPICACGVPFDIQHALSCAKGGFIIGRHNEIRDFTAEVLKEVCVDVKIEPTLQKLTGETLNFQTSIRSDEARADMSARSFWIKGQTAYIDVRVFNPLAKCYLNQTLLSAHKRNENEKKRQYNERINNIDHGSFTPMVFSCFGGMSRECGTFVSQLAELIAEKRNTPKSMISGWLKTRLNFAMLRSCLLCIRGTRTSIMQQKFDLVKESDIKLVVHESNMDV
jgi:hypothetical protein